MGLRALHVLYVVTVGVMKWKRGRILTCRSGGVGIMGCLLPEGAPLLVARPPCMVIDVGDAYAELPLLTLPAESLLWDISLLARCSTSS